MSSEEKLIIKFNDSITTKEILNISRQIRIFSKNLKIKDVIIELKIERIKEYLKDITK